MLANDFVKGWDNYLLFKKYFTGISNEPYLKKGTDSIIYPGQILYSLFIYGCATAQFIFKPQSTSNSSFWANINAPPVFTTSIHKKVEHST